MTREKVKIAIIDSGIDESIGNLMGSVKYSKGFEIGQNGEVIENDSRLAMHPHGTAIALIIQYFCKDVEFYCMNIFDKNLLSDGRILIHAIDEAIKLKPDIIHLSLGTNKLRYFLKLNKLITKAQKEEIIIVSSLSNDGRISFPSNLKGVVRVEGYDFKDCYDFYYYKGRFKAPCDLGSVYKSNDFNYSRFVGNSMAAAYITGHICNLLCLSKDIPHSQVIKLIKQNNKKK